jgi:methyltransferase family protein
MKRFILRAVDRLADRIFSRGIRLLQLGKGAGPSFDIIEVAHLKAALETADYYERNFINSFPIDRDLDLLTRAVSVAEPEGLWLEFGVATGRTISHIAALRNSEIYGFDSFEGLPEPWRSGYGKGMFATEIPALPANVKLIKGWFADTLPIFLCKHPEKVSFLHVDCDLYSSTKTILDLLAPRLGAQCVIVFDEYWNYPGWQQHEHKAFVEFADRTQLKYRYDSFVRNNQQVCIVLD